MQTPMKRGLHGVVHNPQGMHANHFEKGLAIPKYFLQLCLIPHPFSPMWVVVGSIILLCRSEPFTQFLGKNILNLTLHNTPQWIWWLEACFYHGTADPLILLVSNTIFFNLNFCKVTIKPLGVVCNPYASPFSKGCNSWQKMFSLLLPSHTHPQPIWKVVGTMTLLYRSEPSTQYLAKKFFNLTSPLQQCPHPHGEGSMNH